MEICSTFWLPDITDRRQQQEQMPSLYPDHSNVAYDILSIIPHGAGVETSISLEQDVIGWKRLKTTGETLCKQVVVRQFAWANTRLLAGDHPAFNTTSTENDIEKKREAEVNMLYRMATVHEILEMWQGHQYLRATEEDSHTQITLITAVGWISDTQEIENAS